MAPRERTLLKHVALLTRFERSRPLQVGSLVGDDAISKSFNCAKELTMATTPEMREPLFATEVGSYTTTMDDPSMWCPVPGADVEMARFVLGSRTEPHAPQAWIVRQGPDFWVDRHHHDTHRLEVIVSGSYTMNGKDYGAGSVTFFPAGVAYGPLTYGPAGGTVIEFFSDSATLAPIFEQMPNDEIVRNLTAMGMPPKLTPADAV